MLSLFWLGEIGRLQAEIDRQLRVENDLRRQLREREQTIIEIQEVRKIFVGICNNINENGIEFSPRLSLSWKVKKQMVCLYLG